MSQKPDHEAESIAMSYYVLDTGTTYDEEGETDEDMLLGGEEYQESSVDTEMSSNLPLRYRKKRMPAFSNKVYRPYFTFGISIIDVLYMIAEIVVNKGFASMKVNPWFGVSAQTLVDTGAKYVPYIIYENQWWRFITPMFGHVGVIHLAINVGAQLLVGIPLERSIGTWRVAIIYVISGIGGNLLSAVFLPNQIEVGASAAIYGLGCYLLADMVVHWVLIANPRKYCIGLVVGTLFGLLIGLFPGIDNFAHIGGSIAGLLISLSLVPRARVGTVVSTRAKVATFIGPPLLLAFFGVCLTVIYVPTLREAAAGCQWCEDINCLPLFHWC